jgi:DNA-binding transcriptional LysR family regulator
MTVDGGLWNDLRLFLEVARQQSFNKGAQALGASHPTMARAVRRLEKKLGVTLVVAFDTGIELTKEGRALAEKLEPIDHAISNAIRPRR